MWSPRTWPSKGTKRFDRKWKSPSKNIRQWNSLLNFQKKIFERLGKGIWLWRNSSVPSWTVRWITWKVNSVHSAIAECWWRPWRRRSFFRRRRGYRRGRRCGRRGWIAREWRHWICGWRWKFHKSYGENALWWRMALSKFPCDYKWCFEINSDYSV